MRDRFSLRNIPKDAERLAEAIHRQTNLSESDVCRLALMSGMLVEAARLLPEQNGTMGGMDVLHLAKALRRVLGPAIDLLWEQGRASLSDIPQWCESEEEHRYHSMKELHPK